MDPLSTELLWYAFSETKVAKERQRQASKPTLSAFRNLVSDALGEWLSYSPTKLANTTVASLVIHCLRSNDTVAKGKQSRLGFGTGTSTTVADVEDLLRECQIQVATDLAPDDKEANSLVAAFKDKMKRDEGFEGLGESGQKTMNTICEEVSKLRDAQVRLQGEVESLRRDIASLKSQ